MTSQPRSQRAIVLAHDLAARGGAERVAIEAAVALRDSGFEIALVTLGEPCSREALADYFGVELANVRLIAIPRRSASGRGGAAIRRLREMARVSSRLRAVRADVFINCAFRSEVPAVARRNIYYVHFPHELRVPARSVAHRAYMGAARIAQTAVVNRGRPFLDSYDVILANSKFTADQVQSTWNRSAEVVYPPCDLIGPGAEKRLPQIVSVGRFQDREPGRPHKRHDVLIEAFAGLTDLHGEGWSLHLAGSTGSERELARLRELARGLPVVFHPDATKDDLVRLYRESSLYWHAQGYGETAPVAQEHFGITVVEAMSAGLIPLVYDGGGPREIVRPLGEPLTWRTLDGLSRSTRRWACEEPKAGVNRRIGCGRRADDFAPLPFRRSLIAHALGARS